MADQPTTLRLVAGSQTSVLVLLRDERDQPEDLSGMSSPALTIIDDDGTDLVVLDDGAATSNAGEILFTVSAGQAGAYPTSGRYRARVSVTIASAVYKSDLFYVDFAEDIG